VEPVENLVLLESIDQDVEQGHVDLRCSFAHARMSYHAAW
jgi:hypothetical protein